MMGIKVIFAAIIALSALEHQCLAGKGGMGGFGGFGGFGANIVLINQIRSKLTIAQLQSSFAIKTANTSMQNSITLAENRVNTNLAASQSKLAAASGSKPVCENAYKTALSQINTNSIKACDQSEQLKAKSAALAYTHVQISQIYRECMIGTPADQKMCIDDKDTEITEQIDNSLNDILMASTNAPAEVATCTESAADSTLASISAADTAFDTCMSTA